MTLKDIVDFYKKECVCGIDFEFSFLDLLLKKTNPQSPLFCPNSVQRECLLFCCVRGNHQFRMVERDIWDAVAELKKHSILSGTYADFEELYAAVEKAIIGCKNVGNLTVYDTALRIGHLLGISPQKYVYLYAGGYEGYRRATNLYSPPYMGRNDIAIIKALAPEFSVLNATEIEDFFCVCKDFFLVPDNTGDNIYTRIKSAKKCVEVARRKQINFKHYIQWNINRIKNNICVTH